MRLVKYGCMTMLLLTMNLAAGAQVYLGVRAGMNMSTITNNLQNNFEKRVAVGPGGGLVLSIPVAESMVIQPELLINARGTAYKVKTIGIVEKGRIRTFYIDLPVLVKGFLGTGSLRAFLGTGPQISCGLFSQNVYIIYGVGISERESEVNAFPELYKRFELGWDFDIGFRLDLDHSSALEIGLRPMVGVTQLVKNQFTSANTRNIMISLTAVYLFGK